ncbi:putative Bifunctional protein FolD 2 [Paratrimastix pyriformis]|uniref:Bifunctional protein FolD 2 n=1 Tax=Paratrimastix pyriformis TaxID=342808 RepID=A0ABQ8USU7_9EUKA|nr:putative Bifunctional protein FolD 2 [Paratrimastix pyriformis]|eukprot:GAFH01002092.1.p1 GENE.GAFH01002092.1~~GAFH01002092.1.p1  ORF type:complete len:349 (-),score=64.96 GAFH01002092.1:248-1258(-)
MQSLSRFASSGGPLILDGNSIAKEVMNDVRRDVDALFKQYGRRPGLAAILVGDRGDSQSYVKKKVEACKSCGIHSFFYHRPELTSQRELGELVGELNNNPNCHGILVQLPLPKQINQNQILDMVAAEKDVDGFHPFNLGELCITSRQPKFVACTPLGCMELLKRANVALAGKSAVVVGRSQTVGLPMAQLLQRANATVTVAHSKTPNLAALLRTADVVVAATGQPLMVKGEWIKEGAAVIDVGINFVKDPTRKTGLKMVGDVDFETAAKRAGVITPVPGGVGPMTVAMLMRNTAQSARRFFEAQGPVPPEERGPEPEYTCPTACQGSSPRADEDLH